MNPREGSRRADRRRTWLRRLRRACLSLLIACAPVAATSAAEPELPPLAAPGSPRLPGKFVWADLVTGDLDAAQRFYGSLFGWTFRSLGEAAGGYTLAFSDDRPVAGLVPARPRRDAAGVPRWVAYMSVADLPAAAQAITAAGGRQVVTPRLLPQRGEQALFADPEGAVFGIIRSATGDPADYAAEPGEWIWIQLLTRDVAKATAFYAAVAGYEVVENEQSPRADDVLLVKGEFARAAVSALTPAQPQARPAWLPFLRVADLPAALGQLPRIGGRVLVRPSNEIFQGRLAVVADPGGAAIGLMEWDDEADEARKRRP